MDVFPSSLFRVPAWRRPSESFWPLEDPDKAEHQSFEAALDCREDCEDQFGPFNNSHRRNIKPLLVTGWLTPPGGTYSATIFTVILIPPPGVTVDKPRSRRP